MYELARHRTAHQGVLSGFRRHFQEGRESVTRRVKQALVSAIEYPPLAAIGSSWPISNSRSVDGCYFDLFQPLATVWF